MTWLWRNGGWKTFIGGLVWAFLLYALSWMVAAFN